MSPAEEKGRIKLRSKVIDGFKKKKWIFYIRKVNTEKMFNF